MFRCVSLIYYGLMIARRTILSAEEIERVRESASKAIAPLKATNKVYRDRKGLRSAAPLPPYYLVYFLLVELLGFEHEGVTRRSHG